MLPAKELPIVNDPSHEPQETKGHGRLPLHKEKYHPSFKAMLALQKYYLRMPFHRQDYFQSLIGLPIPASTQ